MKLISHRKQTLWREISITLALKLVAIYMLWLLFFSNPVDENLGGHQVGNFLFGAEQTNIDHKRTLTSTEK